MQSIDQANTAFALSIWLSANIMLAVLWDIICVWMGDSQECFISTHLSRWAHDFPIGVLFAGIFLGHILWQTRGRG